MSRNWRCDDCIEELGIRAPYLPSLVESADAQMHQLHTYLVMRREAGEASRAQEPFPPYLLHIYTTYMDTDMIEARL